MNRYGERGPRFWRPERDDDRYRRAEQGRDDYEFQQDEQSGRTAGDREDQPFSGNPYGYYPGQGQRGREARDPRGEMRDRGRSNDRWPRDRGDGGPQYRGGSQRGSQQGYSGSSQDYGSSQRYVSRQGYGGPSQDYGSSQRYGPRQGYGGQSQDYGASRSYGSSQPYGQREPYNARGGSERSRWGGPWNEDGSRYSESQYGMQRNRLDAYGSGAEPEFGEGPFADTSEAPSYFGSGNYSDGGSSFTGGFDQRSRSRYPGSLGDDWFSRDPLSSSRDSRRYRTGPKGYTRSDERIREDIAERLMLADGIDSSEVTISVKDGHVTLEGTVPVRHMKHAIEDLADHTAGVQDVDNRVRVVREGTQTSGTQSMSSPSMSTSSPSSGAPNAGAQSTPSTLTPKTTTKQ